MSKISEPPKMFKQFDSYIEDGRIVILTNEYSEIHGGYVICTHFVRLERAKEIIKDLQDAITATEKFKRIAADEMKHGNRAWE